MDSTTKEENVVQELEKNIWTSYGEWMWRIKRNHQLPQFYKEPGIKNEIKKQDYGGEVTYKG